MSIFQNEHPRDALDNYDLIHTCTFSLCMELTMLTEPETQQFWNIHTGNLFFLLENLLEELKKNHDESLKILQEEQK